MWTYEHSVETTASRDAIWRLWRAVERWGDWNPDIEHIELHGPFASGTELDMTPIDQDPVRLRLSEVRENELFVDEARLGDTVVRTTHRIDDGGAGKLRVTYRMDVTGSDAQELGPAITSDFPETLTALVAHAEA